MIPAIPGLIIIVAYVITVITCRILLLHMCCYVCMYKCTIAIVPISALTQNLDLLSCAHKIIAIKIGSISFTVWVYYVPIYPEENCTFTT